MIIHELPVAELKPYLNNPRMNEKAVDKIASSIKTYGFRQPIVVDKDNVIVVGHTRYKAAVKLGLKTVPVHIADNMSEAEVKAYRIADNKLNELSDWDLPMLTTELSDISEGIQVGDFNLDFMDTGFELADLYELLEGKPLSQRQEKNAFIKDDQVWESDSITLTIKKIDQAESLFLSKFIESYRKELEKEITERKNGD